jgi:tetratricopeptide (TPR) repeat protein
MILFSLFLLLNQQASPCASLPGQEQAEARLSELFDYDRPKESEAGLAELADVALSCGNRELAAASLAQAARAQGIQNRLAEAQTTLDRAARLATIPRTGIKIMLEQGRIARRQRRLDLARRQFNQAFELAEDEREDALAADAAHMLALLESGDSYLQWTARGLAIAEGSQDPVARRWVGNLTYNAAIRLSESGDHQAAALMFARSLAARRIENDAELVAAAELALSAELAHIGRLDEAEAIQRRLLRDAASNPAFAAEVRAQLDQLGKIKQAVGK